MGILYLCGKEDIMPVTEKKYPDWVQKKVSVKGNYCEEKRGFVLSL